MSDFVPEPGPLSPDYVPPEPEPEPEPEPQWQGPTQEDWERSQQAQGFIYDQLERLSRMAEPPDPNAIVLPDDSLLTPDDLNVISELISRAVAPFAATTDQWQQSEGEQRASDVIADDVSRNGDFILEGSAEKARALSENYYSEAAARYGPGPQAAEAAIQQACADVRDWERQVGEAYHERQNNQLHQLSRARPEPRAQAQTVPVTTGPLMDENGRPLDEMAIVRKYGGFAQ